MNGPLRRTVAAVAVVLCAAALPATPSATAAPAPAPADAQAQWIDRNTVIWKGAERTAATAAGVRVRDGLRIRLTPGTLTDAQKAELPAPDRPTPPSPSTRATATGSARPCAASSSPPSAAAAGAVLAATGVQIPGVLDDLYAGQRPADAALGPVFRKGRPTLSVWAPTARKVALELDGRPSPMRRDDATGVWSRHRHRRLARQAVPLRRDRLGAQRPASSSPTRSPTPTPPP